MSGWLMRVSSPAESGEKIFFSKLMDFFRLCYGNSSGNPVSIN